MSGKRRREPTAEPRDARGDRAGWIVAAYLAVLPLLFVGRGALTDRVTAPLDALLVMDPWRITSAREFPEFEAVQAPLLDCVTQYLPWRTAAKEALAQGELPLWNAHAFSGYPFVANHQSAVFYPPNLVFWLLPLSVAYDVSAYLALLLAGAFAYGLARDLGVSRLGACMAATGFVASGYMTAWLCYMGPVNSFLWTPLALWMLRKHQREGGWRPLAGLALAVAMACLGGHAQSAVYGLGAAFAYAVLLHWGRRGEARGSWIPAAGAAALGLAAAAIQLLPTLELARSNYRLLAGNTPPRGLVAGQLNALIAPQAHGHINWLNEYGGAFGFHNYVETCAYVALVLVWLAAVALLAGEGRDRWFLGGLAAAGVVLALEGPHQSALHAALPPLRQMSNVGRAVCLYGLATPLLGGLGYDTLRRMDWSDEKRRSRLAAGGLILLMASALAVSVSFSRAAVVGESGAAAVVAQRMAPVYRSLYWAIALVILLAGLTLLARRTQHRGVTVLIAVLLLADVLAFAGRFQPATDPRLLTYEPPVLRDLARVTGRDYRMYALPPPADENPMAYLHPNLPTLAGLRDADGYESLYPLQAYRPLKLLRDGSPAQRREALDQLAVRALYSRADPSTRYGGVEATRSALIYTNPTAWPIAFRTDTERLPDAPPEPASVRWMTNARRFTDGGGWVWLGETCFSGWRAYADGEPTPLERPSMYRWRARGGGVTDFVYEPGSFGVGAFLTLMATLVAAMGLGYLVPRRLARRAATRKAAHR